jgi:HEPN domain-containing protein
MNASVDPWLSIAMRDLKASKQICQSSNNDLKRAVCFWAQESARKHLIAVLIFENCTVVREWELSRLLELTSPYLKIPASNKSLTIFSSVTDDILYPYTDEPDWDMANICIETADIIQTTVLQYLAEKGVRHADDL